MRFSISVQEKEKIFITELVKAGISYQQATRAAKLLTAEQADDLLTEEEIQLVKDACQEWLKRRKQQSFVTQVLSSIATEKMTTR